MEFLPLFAQTQSSGNLMQLLFPMLLLFGAMYFFIIAPQRKKDKAQKQMIAAIKNGDRVVTIGGIFGTVTAVKDDRFHLKVDDSTRIEILRTAIQSVVQAPSKEDASK